MTPLPYRWLAGTMIPLNGYFDRKAAEQFVDGQTYTLAPVEDRSPKSHAHEFAWLNEAWESLPEELAERFPTVEHLRKHALIRAGFCTVREYACASKAEADRLHRTLMAEADPYALVIVSGSVVRVYKAQSQSRRAMDRKTFQESKDGILRVVSEMLGVEPTVLQRQGSGEDVGLPAEAA